MSTPSGLVAALFISRDAVNGDVLMLYFVAWHALTYRSVLSAARAVGHPRALFTICSVHIYELLLMPLLIALLERSSKLTVTFAPATTGTFTVVIDISGPCR